MEAIDGFNTIKDYDTRVSLSTLFKFYLEEVLNGCVKTVRQMEPKWETILSHSSNN